MKDILYVYLWRLSLKIEFDSPNDILSRNHVEASRNAEVMRDLHRLFADVVMVLRVTVSDELATRFPAASLLATR